MELSFDTKLLRTECLDQAEAERSYGPTVAAGLRTTLADLDAAVTVADLPATAAVRLTEEELRVVVAPKWTLVCIPGGRQHRRAPFDWSHVYRLKLMKIEEEM